MQRVGEHDLGEVPERVELVWSYGLGLKLRLMRSMSSRHSLVVVD